MNDQEATSLVQGLVFAVQKIRSDLREGLGADESPDGQVMTTILEEMHPWVFGPQSVLPKLLEWQTRMQASKVILGAELFNMVKWVDMKDRLVLVMLPLYGYTPVPDEGPPIDWFGQTWTYTA